MKNIPSHVAIIMDGNRRWAQMRGLSAINGHNHGAKNLKKIVKYAIKIGIKELSIFAFSTENWNRVKKERVAIFSLFKRYLNSEIVELDKNNVKFSLIGSLENFSENLVELVKKAEKITEKNTGLQFNVAVDYGGRSDILYAVNEIVLLSKQNKLKYDEIDEKTFSSHMISKNVSNIDLLIRTSGEQRLSNFMIWQLIYSELYFTDSLWPDFDENEFLSAVNIFAKRDRRFGSSNVM